MDEIDQNSIIDSIMADLGAAAETSSHARVGGVPTVFAREGQARVKFVLDKNNKLVAQARVYQATTTDAEGKSVTVRCLATENDPLAPIVDELDNWRYRPRFTAVIYTYVFSSNWKDSKGNQIKDQLVRLVVNKSFLKSLNEILKNIASNSRNKFMSLVGKSEPGLAFNISITGSGVSATVSISPDAFGGEVTIPEEAQAKIDDVSDVSVLPKKEFNDQNTSLVKAAYLKILEEQKQFTDKPSASGNADEEPVSEDEDGNNLPF